MTSLRKDAVQKKKCAAGPSLQAKVVKQKKTDDGIEVKLAFSLLDHIMERLFVNLIPRVLSFPPYGTRLIICHFNFEICAWNCMVLPFKWNLFSRTYGHLFNADTHLISFIDSSAGPNDVKHQIIHASAIWIPLLYWQWSLSL